MTIQDRLNEFLAAKRMTNKAFEDMCGLSNGASVKFGANIRRKTIDRVSNAFPDLNTDWLVYGEGEMLRPAQITQTVTGNNNIGNNITNTAADAYLRIIEQQQQTIAKLTDLLLQKNDLPSQASR